MRRVASCGSAYAWRANDRCGSFASDGPGPAGAESDDLMFTLLVRLPNGRPEPTRPWVSWPRPRPPSCVWRPRPCARGKQVLSRRTRILRAGSRGRPLSRYVAGRRPSGNLPVAGSASRSQNLWSWEAPTGRRKRCSRLTCWRWCGFLSSERHLWRRSFSRSRSAGQRSHASSIQAAGDALEIGNRGQAAVRRGVGEATASSSQVTSPSGRSRHGCSATRIATSCIVRTRS